ncbi:hypothetical protein J6590_043810 [Homalodisca vitripennis]|nr:hypothetical protein J6590_043810 [Homalodisca vitripennis]
MAIVVTLCSTSPRTHGSRRHNSRSASVTDRRYRAWNGNTFPGRSIAAVFLARNSARVSPRLITPGATPAVTRLRHWDRQKHD